MLALSALLFGIHLLPESESQAVAWKDLSSQVGPLVIVRAEDRVFRSHGQLARYLKGAKTSRSVPAMDFSSRQLLLVSPGPRSSTGYSVEVQSARVHGNAITVRVRERFPGLGEKVEPRVTYPYRLLSLPAGKNVYVDWPAR